MTVKGLKWKALRTYHFLCLRRILWILFFRISWVLHQYLQMFKTILQILLTKEILIYGIFRCLYVQWFKLLNNYISITLLKISFINYPYPAHLIISAFEDFDIERFPINRISDKRFSAVVLTFIILCNLFSDIVTRENVPALTWYCGNHSNEANNPCNRFSCMEIDSQKRKGGM